jgi:hypothetical protein
LPDSAYAIGGSQVTRVLKVVAAGVAAGAAIAAAFFLHPRAGARRRAAVRRESANVAALFGATIESTPRRLWRRRVGDGLEDRARHAMDITFGDAANEIIVRAQDGVVTLRGEVDQLSQITRFEEAIRAVPGVVDIDNLLRLRLSGAARPRILSA